MSTESFACRFESILTSHFEIGLGFFRCNEICNVGESFYSLAKIRSESEFAISPELSFVFAEHMSSNMSSESSD